jgi:small-conductance mechanosensitive channel
MADVNRIVIVDSARLNIISEKTLTTVGQDLALFGGVTKSKRVKEYLQEAQELISKSEKLLQKQQQREDKETKGEVLVKNKKMVEQVDRITKKMAKLKPKTAKGKKNLEDSFKKSAELRKLLTTKTIDEPKAFVMTMLLDKLEERVDYDLKGGDKHGKKKRKA